MNDVVPSNEPKVPQESGVGGIVKSLIEGGLPQIIAGPAGKAISRLIGGAADIPAAWLEKKAQAIRDEKEARTALIKKMSGSVADLANSNPELTQRAMERWLGKELTKQANVEAVISKSVDILDVSKSQDEVAADGKDVAEEWLNVFGEHAERASTEEVRLLWARVLAGEIRKNGSFSLRTLSFLSTIDQRTAEIFKEFSDFSDDFGRIFKFGDWAFQQGPPYSRVLHLISEGLLQDGSAHRHQKGTDIIPFQNQVLLIQCNEDTQVLIDVLRFTRVGLELFGVVERAPSNLYIAKLAEHLTGLFGEKAKVLVLPMSLAQLREIRSSAPNWPLSDTPGEGGGPE